MKNNLSQKQNHLRETNIVYQFNCKHDDCMPRNAAYVDLTTTTLSRRLTMHLQSGTITKHYAEKHGKILNRSELVNNTVIPRLPAASNL